MSSFYFSEWNIHPSGVVKSSDELFGCENSTGKLQSFEFAQEPPADPLHASLQGYVPEPSDGNVSVFDPFAPTSTPWRPGPIILGWSETLSLDSPNKSAREEESQTLLGGDVAEVKKRKRSLDIDEDGKVMGTPEQETKKARIVPLRPLRRRGRGRKAETDWARQEEGTEGSGGEHDNYLRHPSSSPSSVWDPYSSSASPEATNDQEDEESPKKGKGRKGKGKGSAQGSAAHALAQLTKFCGKDSQNVHFPLCGDSKEGTGSSVAGTRAGKQRRNGRIPLPVPVPNLVKTSRGRKVPFVVEVGGTQAASGSGSSSSNNAKVEQTSEEDDKDGEGEEKKRTFVCEVAGCGKCFVRGEHLKRHIRSIHTYEKPYVCPACGKSFSRRDNLGQHVRLHVGQLSKLGYSL